MTQRVEISYKTIVFTVFFLIFLWILFQIKDIIFLLFVSFVGMSALRPFVDRIEKMGLPRIAAILIIYLLGFLFLGILGTAIFPPLINQSINLGRRFPQIIDTILPFLNLNRSFITEQIAPLGQNVLRLTIGVFSNLLAIVTVLVFTFYFLLERTHLRIFFNQLIGEKTGKKFFEFTDRIEKRLGSWIRAQATLAVIIGVASFIGLSLLEVDFALPLAILAGILEIVPIIGPIIAAIPAILVAALVSPFLALAVAALYIIIQQLENSLLVPMVMKKATGLPPLVTILSLMIGGKLGGIMGALFAVPAVIILQTLLSEALKAKKE